jgi:hypothetical protein
LSRRYVDMTIGIMAEASAGMIRQWVSADIEDGQGKQISHPDRAAENASLSQKQRKCCQYH